MLYLSKHLVTSELHLRVSNSRFMTFFGRGGPNLSNGRPTLWRTGPPTHNLDIHTTPADLCEVCLPMQSYLVFCKRSLPESQFISTKPESFSRCVDCRGLLPTATHQSLDSRPATVEWSTLSINRASFPEPLHEASQWQNSVRRCFVCIWKVCTRQNPIWLGMAALLTRIA